MTNVTSTPNRTHSVRSIMTGSRSWMRVANVVLGIWLFLSAFLWPHSPGSKANTWIVGLIVMAVAALGSLAPASRWLNTAAAVWLFFSTFWLSHVSRATVWNNAIVAVVVFLVSLIANARTARTNLPPM